MSHNIRIGADAHAGHVLDLLRREDGAGELSDEVALGPDVALRADPALRLAGHWRSPHGEVLHVTARPQAAGAWFALHVALRAEDFGPLGVFGFAMRARMAQTGTLRAALRSGTADGFRDAFFDKHVLLRPRESAHVDALDPSLRTDVPERAPWREFVLFLPLHEVGVEIHDLRVFAV